MPQADYVLTVQLADAPTGIFHDVSRARRQADTVDSVRSRLDEIGAALFLMKSSEDVSQPVALALGAIEMMVNDTAALLSVRAGGVA